MMTARVSLGGTLDATLRELVLLLPSWSKTKARTPDGAVAFASPVAFPLFNGVVDARFGADDADRRIEEVLDVFRRAHRPMLWWVGPWTGPDDLDRRLPDHELRKFTDLTVTTLGVPPRADGPIVERAEALTLLDDWLRPDTRGYAQPPNVSTAFVGADAVPDADAPLRHYRARREHDVLGYASLFCGPDAALVCNVCVEPGTGTDVDRALIRTLLADAGDLGYERPVTLTTGRGDEAVSALGPETGPGVTQFLWMDLTDPRQPLTGI